MDKDFEFLKNVTKKRSSVGIDSTVFRLHYKVTAIVLCSLSFLSTSNQYIGKPIACVVDEIPQSVMDAYCWVSSTFTVPQHLVGRLGVDIVQPGVAPHVSGEDPVTHQKYYQWVCFVLLFQAVLFYIPRYLWISWEGSRLKVLTENFENELAVEYFDPNSSAKNYYAHRFFFCEFLNLVNVIGQIFFMDYFLDGEFLTYGWDVLLLTDMDPEDRNDPMSRIFPKVTKCTFNKYGPTGTVQKFDGICVLALNIVNEKIYVFIWFWFILLAIITAISLLYRLTIVFSKKVREGRLIDRFGVASHKQLTAINQMLQIGDWFVLYELGSELKSKKKNKLIENVLLKLEEKKDAGNIKILEAGNDAT